MISFRKSTLMLLIASLQATTFVHGMRRNPFLSSSSSSSSSTLSNSNSNTNNYRERRRINTTIKNHYQTDDDEYDNNDDLGLGLKGSGREFNIFSNRGGDMTSSSERGAQQPWSYNPNRRTKLPHSRRNSYYKSTSSTTTSPSSSNNKSILSSIKEWITNGNLPKIQCRVEPNTTLKVRKTFRPLKTIVRLGADFNTQLGVWQFKSSWEDDVIGGKLTLAGRELQFSKTWLLSVGAYRL